MNVGAFSLSPAVMVAPMAGVTDLPFRETVHDFGRVWVEGEMVSANPDLLESNESERKIAFGDEPSPRIVQLLGAVPAWMNRTASFVEECGADIIDINMGCPAKKICKTDCGSALMKNLPLADEIIRGVCGTVSVPVTLKMRTGWDSDHLNAPELARIAESAGVRLITVHGRTREQGYSGERSTEPSAKSGAQSVFLLSRTATSILLRKPLLFWISPARTASWWGEALSGRHGSPGVSARISKPVSILVSLQCREKLKRCSVT